MNLALEIWVEAGGLNWQALPILFDMHGVTDPESMLHHLMAIDKTRD